MRESANSAAIIKEVIRLIKELRISKGFTLDDIADRAGVHRTTIGLLERGERSPTLGLAHQLATALEVSLSSLVQHAELITSGSIREKEVVQKISRRQVKMEHLRNEEKLQSVTGLDGQAIVRAIESTYYTLDIIDEQLIARNSPPMAQLVELANLSSMLGNLLGAGLAESSNGLYKRNAPHTYPDLLPIKPEAVDLELKVALETNSPKGHLPKHGSYITFRYVLCGDDGLFIRGKNNRGKTAWIWEVRVGQLSIEDFSISNTAGDSGKTAVIKTGSFNNMSLIYFVPELLPYASRQKYISRF
ncbi:MAG TPA: helix-turn-helix transcriptional regulator [Pyrinomonadaceae bacterium]|nr:helix-turn-helix transcriptional regulator [Pyrinomonadaceae bacterium]